MPQMMPMYWLIMYLFMILSLLFITSILYFLNLPTLPPLNPHLSSSSSSWNWKW